MEGPWVHYWANGQLSDKGTYKSGKTAPWVGDRREGPRVGFNRDGTVDKKKTETFKDGKKVK